MAMALPISDPNLPILVPILSFFVPNLFILAQNLKIHPKCQCQKLSIFPTVRHVTGPMCAIKNFSTFELWHSSILKVCSLECHLFRCITWRMVSHARFFLKSRAAREIFWGATLEIGVVKEQFAQECSIFLQARAFKEVVVYLSTLLRQRNF